MQLGASPPDTSDIFEATSVTLFPVQRFNFAHIIRTLAPPLLEALIEALVEPVCELRAGSVHEERS